MKFKVGDKVVVKSHLFDSSANLEIGYTGTVTYVTNHDEDMPYEVKWDKFNDCITWWVAEECIRPYKLVLENK